ncbi:MAG: hypothetical protein VCD00_10260 [Candidatus Hydrogenedentota bacterium]
MKRLDRVLWCLMLFVGTITECLADEGVPSFIISTVAGTGEGGFSGDGGPAIKAKFSPVTSVAIDSVGNLYIADNGNRRVRKVTRDGIVHTVAGTGKSRPQEDDLPALETNLVGAYGIAVDSKDNLYVLNRRHSKIYRIGPDGIAHTIVGTGEKGFNGDGILANKAMISWPNHLVENVQGELIIADSGNYRIRVVGKDGIIRTIGGTGEKGFSGDGGPATEARISGASAIAIDREGNIYFADFSNHRIRKIAKDGIITTVAGTGNPAYNGEGLRATEANIGEPCGVAVDDDGILYIGDQVNNRVRSVAKNGLMFTVSGTGERGYAGDGGPALQALNANPDIMAFDQGGNLYFADNVNCCIRKLTRVTSP